MIVVTTPSDIAETGNKNPFSDVPNRVAMPTIAASPAAGLSQLQGIHPYDNVQCALY